MMAFSSGLGVFTMSGKSDASIKYKKIYCCINESEVSTSIDAFKVIKMH